MICSSCNKLIQNLEHFYVFRSLLTLDEIFTGWQEMYINLFDNLMYNKYIEFQNNSPLSKQEIATILCLTCNSIRDIIQ